MLILQRKNCQVVGKYEFIFKNKRKDLFISLFYKIKTNLMSKKSRKFKIFKKKKTTTTARLIEKAEREVWWCFPYFNKMKLRCLSGKLRKKKKSIINNFLCLMFLISCSKINQSHENVDFASKVHEFFYFILFSNYRQW